MARQRMGGRGGRLRIGTGEEAVEIPIEVWEVKERAMTEQQWLESADPAAMLDWRMGSNPLREECPTPPPSRRKLGLFASECVHIAYDGEVLDNGPDKPPCGWTVEQWARRWASEEGVMHEKLPASIRADILRDIFGNPFRRHAWTDAHDCSPSGHELQFLDRGWLRWHDGIVPRLAQAAYEERAPNGMLDAARLAVIADALEEAGAPADGELVRHLRGWSRCPECFNSGMVGCVHRHGKHSRHPGYYPCAKCRVGDDDEIPGTGWVRSNGPHVRGCHAIDTILGKE